MTLLERLQAHKGGLVRIKSQLYWHGGRGWDRFSGRICLILDVATDNEVFRIRVNAHTPATTPRGVVGADALLLIDGAPRWVWVADEDIELLDGGDR